MAKRGPLDLVHWLAGYDLAGIGAITDVDELVEAATDPNVTPLGPMGAFEHEAPLGRLRYSLSETGLLRERQASLRRLLQASVPATPWRSILGHSGGAIGADCLLATDLRIRRYSLVPQGSGISRVSNDYYLAGDGDLYEDARLLAHGIEAGVGPGASPASRFRLDQGASTNTGAAICIMFDPDLTRWRGYPTLTFQVRQSADEITWSDLGSAWNVSRDDAPAHLIVIASGTTVERHLALQWTFSGTRDAFALEGDHSNGDTTITIDGGTGTERVEAGDMLDIGGGTYTVDSATESSPGTWSVNLTGGLVGDQSDGEAVTLTGDNTSLKYVAAVDRGGHDAAADTTPPVFQSARVNGDTLTLHYNELLDSASVPAVGDFDVQVAGSADVVTSVAIAGTEVTLTLTTAVTFGQTVTVAYTQGTTPIQDVAGNDAATFAATAVLNQTPAPSPMNYLATSTDALIAANEFTVSDTDKTLLIPAYTGARYIAFAIPETDPDITSLYIYQPAHPNQINQSAAFQKQTGTVSLGGVPHKWWLSRVALSGFGGYILEFA